MPTLRHQALAVLQECNPASKATRARAVDARTDTGAGLALHEPSGLPGRPARPLLVDADRVPKRSVATTTGRAALVHAIAHIELNAIDLAADACWRFAGLPDPFYRDWTRVMAEEALHFRLLTTHLAELGHEYGDFPAHDGLWHMAERTRGDVLARMALVPRTLEARGLDASPAVRHRLASAGDAAGAAIIDRLLEDEIGHVEIGNRWYRWLCDQKGIEPVATYALLASRYAAPTLRGPFNLTARRRAGFTEDELQALGSAALRARVTDPG